MKINHISTSKVLVLLALILATLYGGGIGIHAQMAEYLAGEVPIDPSTGVPGSSTDRRDRADLIFMADGGPELRHVSIVAYPHEEIGEQVRWIHQFGFYLYQLTGSGVGTMRGITVLYRFTDDDIYLPTNQYYGTSHGHDIATTATNYAISDWNKDIGLNNDRYIYYDENGVDAWTAKGYTEAFTGTIAWPASGWINFNLPQPYFYTGEQNLHIVVIYDQNVPNEITPVFAARQLGHLGLVMADEGLSEHPNDGCANISDAMNPVYGSMGSYNNGRDSKPILRLITSQPTIEVTEVFPGYNTANLSYRQGEVLVADSNYLPGKRPSFTIDYNNILEEDENLPTQLWYTIEGPFPSTDIVYSMLVPDANPSLPDLPYKTVTKSDYVGSDYIGTEQVPKATGPMAWQSGAGADNVSFDLRNVLTGRYEAKVKAFTTDPEGTYQFADTIRGAGRFYVRTNNDIEVSEILQPLNESFHAVLNPTGMLTNIPVVNAGFNDINEFWAQIYLRKINYDPDSKIVTASPTFSEDTLPHIGGSAQYYHFDAANSLNGPIRSGQTLMLNHADFSGGFSNLEAGWYSMEVKVWLDDPQSVPDMPKEYAEHLFNNTYPRPGYYHVLQAQSIHDPWLTRHTNLNQTIDYVTQEPTGLPLSRFALGRTMNIEVGLINDGLIDISHASGITLETIIRRISSSNVPGDTVFRTTDIATRGGVGEREVKIYCADSWYINETGRFEVITRLIYDGAPAGWECKDSEISSIIIVSDGLSGNYTIGRNITSDRNFTSINRALIALYSLGVTGDCTFELTEKEYTEEPINPTSFDMPALDFRSRIAGVSEIRKTADGRDTAYINRIRFVPSAELSMETSSIKINLVSRSGVGMWFGATSDISMYRDAMVNVVAAAEKRRWYRSDGYITWDGGPNKSFEIRYKLPATSDRMPGERFRVPIYMTNAKNITITNCIITDSTAQPSSHYQLSGNTYIGPTLYWAEEYDFMTNNPSAQKTYSSGVIVRSNPLIQLRFGENRYGYETFPCNDIVVSNNEISRFAYGIVDIGLNYTIDNNPFVIDMLDTLWGVSRSDLDDNADLRYIGTQSTTNPDGTTTTVASYTHNTISNTRFIRYYKLFNDNYLVIVDSAAGGVRRAFNYNNAYQNNLIYDVNRAGILLGNNEKSVVSGNRINGVNGTVTNETGAIIDIDCAGIMLGGTPRTSADATRNYDAFMVLDTKVYNNEISDVKSNVATHGIKIEQNVLTEGISSTPAQFPDHPERMKIYSNIIWGIQPNGNAEANRHGISLSIKKPDNATSLFSTINDAYYIDDILLANNTILLEEDNISGSRGDYYGLYLQKVKNANILNNAIELTDSTHHYFHLQRDNAAASVFYQGPSPAEANNTVNYNVYAFKTTGNSDVAAYRYVNTDYTSGMIVDKGTSDEYQLLRNWQNWMNDDIYSNTQSFASDLVKMQNPTDKFNKLRMRTDAVIANSPLDKRGIYIAEAVTDIDGNNRLKTDQAFDVGAQIVDGIRNAIDVEVVNIVSPATYQAVRGPFMDAEYFMINDEPINVRVLIRNNGAAAVQNKKISLRVLQETELINNRNAQIHTENYTNLYYNDETAHNAATSNFEPINSNAIITYYPMWDTTRTVTIPAGEGVYIDFKLSKTFNTYFTLPGYEVPIQFSRMTPNVTPRYMFSVSLDPENDLKPENNILEKYARFYVKKSKRDMLISASNTFNTINNNNLPSEAVSNPDIVAGRLNLDSLIAGFRKLNLHQSDAEAREFDFDVIDRKAWDFRNIDYTLYKTIYYSDELKIDTARWFDTAKYDNTYRYYRDRWLMQNLNDFLTKANLTNKSNLIVGSEEHLSDIYAAIGQHEYSFLQPNNTLKSSVTNNFYRASAIFDSLWYKPEHDPNGGDGTDRTLYSYSPRVPLSIYTEEYRTEPYSHWFYEFTPQTYVFKDTDTATITGTGPFAGYKFTIKATPWANSTLTDAPPIGTIIKPIDNAIGLQQIAAIVDTISERGQPITGNIADIPKGKRIISLTQNTMQTNIVFLGFDWRHYGNLDMLLIAIDEHIRNNGGYDGGPVLPISFYGFDAQPIANRVELTWNTASETIINNFELERANVINGNNNKFELIESIQGKPNTSDNSYNTTDRNLEYGSTLAYRLKLINADGSYTYSDSKIVKIEDATFSVSDITPNPISSTATFNVTLPASQNIHIAIYDMTGRALLVLNDGILSSGVSNFSISNDELAAGTYTLIVRSGHHTTTRAFTVVK